MALPEEILNKVADGIVAEVTALHIDHQPRQWNAMAGQWLVYGFEKYFGFPGAVELEAVVERAWISGQPMKPKIMEFLREQT